MVAKLKKNIYGVLTLLNSTGCINYKRVEGSLCDLVVNCQNYFLISLSKTGKVPRTTQESLSC